MTLNEPMHLPFWLFWGFSKVFNLIFSRKELYGHFIAFLTPLLVTIFLHFMATFGLARYFKTVLFEIKTESGFSKLIPFNSIPFYRRFEDKWSAWSWLAAFEFSLLWWLPFKNSSQEAGCGYAFLHGWSFTIKKTLFIFLNIKRSELPTSDIKQSSRQPTKNRQKNFRKKRLAQQSGGNFW